ncbi:Chaperone protein DnaK [Thalassoglobus neptunius]|uniref:Chaperone protein DnaK n=1 Tax=Thalassoglobus neptunius TaxID=1938619 RepID=A0A5C5X606_9PLAN|nr:Hsp70 family protein [Thalassoglobus neptunius]TWT58354.1 Chaperone protein DnaK [Thalassoglobus neptunius]
MSLNRTKKRVHPIGIDLGTTYSCISHLTPSGQPVPIPNSEGELSTPSVVLFDGDEVVVGTEALRNAVMMPDRVVRHAKRFMGDPNKTWIMDHKVYRPKDISAFILKKLLESAEERLGRIHCAVITVPAQFSDVQRQLTVEAGLEAGLDRVDIINEPVATAMCHVLSDGMWFAELANEQTVMVFDLGGGTFDLSLVRYNQNEVTVIASGGDLRLGGLDWNKVLEEFACDRYVEDSISDPRIDRESMQALATEIEQVKRSLSVRPRASILVQHDGRRKTFAISRETFEMLSKGLVDRTEEITRQMLKDHKLGWAHVDSVLVTGGASRMPMVREMLQNISGTTLNTTLSPDQSIANGAAYYAGMLLSGQRLQQSSLDDTASARLQNFQQRSVTGRGLGILIRDPETDLLRPHYLIPSNTQLPCIYKQDFGTVRENQKRVHLHIVESGASQGEEFVELGDCLIDDLPPNLPMKSPISVTIGYNEQGRLRVSAIETTSGREARATIVRPGETETAPPEAPVDDQVLNDDFEMDLDTELDQEPEQSQPPVSAPSLERERSAPMQGSSSADELAHSSVPMKSAVEKKAAASAVKTSTPKTSRSSRKKAPPKLKSTTQLERAERPIPLCNQCGHPLDKQHRCQNCSKSSSRKRRPPRSNP